MQEQKAVTESQTKAFQTLISWLERQEAGFGSEDEELLDENSLAYLHSYRDQFTRFSLFSVRLRLEISVWHLFTTN
jgi:hypothetical protein